MSSSSELNTRSNKKKELENTGDVSEIQDKINPDEETENLEQIEGKGEDTENPEKVEGKDEIDCSEDEPIDSLNDSLIEGFSDSLRGGENKVRLIQDREDENTPNSGESSDISLDNDRRLGEWRSKADHISSTSKPFSLIFFKNPTTLLQTLRF